MHRALVALALAVAAAGCSGGGTAAPTMTVAGSVRTYSGQPLAGMTVVIAGKNTTTDPTGAFSIAGVGSPYDAQIVDASSSWVTLYQGLTRPDPILSIGSSAPVHTATVSGSLTGGANPPGQGAAVFPALPGPVPYGGYGVSPTSGAFSWTAFWSGSDSVSAVLIGEELTGTGGQFFYGMAPVTLTQGASIQQDVPLTRYANQGLSGHVTGEPSGAVVDGIATLVLGSGLRTTFSTGGSDPSGNFGAGAVSFPGVTYDLTAAVISSSAGTLTDTMRGLSAGASGLAFTLHPAPVPGMPGNAVGGVTSQTSFAWTGSDFPAVYLVTFTPMAGGSEPTFTVVTAALKATIPVGTAQGLPLPSGATYLWRVDALGPHGSVDEAAGGLYPAGPYHESTSAPRTFTTQ